MDASVKTVDWSPLAQCADLSSIDADRIFFTVYRGRPPKNAEYNKYCDKCIVKIQCFKFAVVHNEQGVWGGTTWYERNQLPIKYIDELINEAQRDGWYEHRSSQQGFSTIKQIVYTVSPNLDYDLSFLVIDF